MTWDEICSRDEYRGRWVALDGCSYDETTGKATEGALVDIDDDLVELCERIRDPVREWDERRRALPPAPTGHPPLIRDVSGAGPEAGIAGHRTARGRPPSG
jgi:hypothetical protein